MNLATSLETQSRLFSFGWELIVYVLVGMHVEDRRSLKELASRIAQGYDRTV